MRWNFLDPGKGSRGVLAVVLSERLPGRREIHGRAEATQRLEDGLPLPH